MVPSQLSTTSTSKRISSSSFTAHPRRRPPPQRRCALGMAITVQEVAGAEVEEVAAFFVDTFWGADNFLKDGQRRQLLSEQRRDLRERYGDVTVARKVRMH
jgi:hypothetical protein